MKSLVQTKVVLPVQVPSRLLFQVGPEGQDPIVDAVEDELRSSSLRVTQESASSVTLSSYSSESNESAKRMLMDWIGQIEKVTVSIDQCPAELSSKLTTECALYLHNQTWICSAVAEGSRAVITGHAEALSGALTAIYETIVSVGGVSRDRITETREPLQEGNNVPKNLPKYRYAGFEANECAYVLDRCEEVVDSPVIPLSVFDAFRTTPIPSEDCRVEIFQKISKIDKVKSVPGRVMTRLEQCIGIGTRFTVLDDDFVDIRCSSTESDLAVSEEILNACAQKRVVGSSSVSVRIPKKLKLDKALLHKLEHKLSVVIVNASSDELIIVGRPNVLKCCKLHLIRNIENRNHSGYFRLDEFSVIDSQVSADACRRADNVLSVSGAPVAVERIGNRVVVAGEISPEVVKSFLNQEFPVSDRIFVPVPIDWSNICQLESKHRCLVEFTSCSIHDWVVQPKNFECKSVQIVARRAMDRLGALIELLTSLFDFYDFATLKFSLGENMFIHSVHTEDGSRLAAVRSALHVVGEFIPEYCLSVIAGDDRLSVIGACDILRSGDMVQSCFGFMLTVTTRGNLSSSLVGRIETELCCVIEPRSDNRIVTISRSHLRRSLARFVLSSYHPEDTLDSVLMGWTRNEDYIFR